MNIQKDKHKTKGAMINLELTEETIQSKLNTE